MLTLLATLALARQTPTPQEPSGLFLAHCATCHGERGDGQGVTLLPRPARSFLAGGFSYGNTREALARTITHGIPGTPMPGFGASLGEAERSALVEYVIALGPERHEVVPSETVLPVRERALVVRGLLPPAAEGAPESTRGLLVGLPTGTTFQYRADDVRLIAVRQGEFVERRDWSERGGDALRPLGSVTFLCEGGRPPATFRWNGVPLSARLASTRVQGERASLTYLLHDAQGRDRARVTEIPRARTTSRGAGFSRAFVLATPSGGDAGELSLDVLHAPGPLEPLSLATASNAGLEASCAWRAPDGSFLAAHLRGPKTASLGAEQVAVALEPGSVVELELTLLATLQWDARTCAALGEELRR